MRRKLAAGNWKMHGLAADLPEVDQLAALYPTAPVDIVLCPPAPLIDRMAARVATGVIALGGQTCHPAIKGAHTGDISAQMLADAGARYVILGHSERRADHRETDTIVRAQARAAIEAGLVAIICLGETEAERDAGRTLEVVTAQLAGSLPDRATGDTCVVAYEPVWAIGTGRVPSPDQIAEVHGALRRALTGHLGADTAGAIRLLYGGSVKPDNAAGIFAIPDVDGALVGGASLKAADFAAIIDALAAS
jgi:triosephosphate isomerase